MKTNLNDFAPMGIDPNMEIKYLLFGLACACLWSIFSFGSHYLEALQALYYSHTQYRVLIPGAVMTGFFDLLLGGEFLFSMVCLVMPLLAVYHYRFHRQGAMTVYLMRRLPNRWEYHRRCLAIPALGVVTALALQGLLAILFYLVYRIVTPARCLPM